jgi:hypothetical protein
MYNDLLKLSSDSTFSSLIEVVLFVSILGGIIMIINAPKYFIDKIEASRKFTATLIKIKTQPETKKDGFDLITKYWVRILVVITLLITNPTRQEYEDHIYYSEQNWNTKHLNCSKGLDLLVFSTFTTQITDNQTRKLTHKRHIGIMNNFIQISSITY